MVNVALVSVQHPALQDPPCVALGLILGNTHANQSADNPSKGSNRTHSRQRGDDRSCCYEWTQSWNGDRSDSGEQSQDAAGETTCDHAAGYAFRYLGIFCVSEIVGSLTIGEEYGDIRIPEDCTAQVFDTFLNRHAVRIDSKYSSLFRHLRAPPLWTEVLPTVAQLPSR